MFCSSFQEITYEESSCDNLLQQVLKKYQIITDDMQCKVCANHSPILLLDGFVTGFDTIR